MRDVAGFALSVCLCTGVVPCFADVHLLRTPAGGLAGQTALPDNATVIRVREAGSTARTDSAATETMQRLPQAAVAYAVAKGAAQRPLEAAEAVREPSVPYVSASLPDSGVPPSGRWWMLASGIAIVIFIAHLRSGPLRS